MKQRSSANSPARNRAVGVLALSALSALVLSGCSAEADAASSSAVVAEEINITVLSDITGKAGFYGTAIETSAKFAVDEINANGGMDGHKIVLSIKDTTSTAATASSLMNDAISDGTDVIIFGVLSEEALAIAPLAQDAGIPMINIQAAGDGVVETGDAIWRITPPQANFYPTMADYVAEEFQAKTAAVFYITDNAPSVALATEVFPVEFERAGITVTDSVSSSSTETDLTTAVTRLLAGNPDFIMTQAIGAQNITLITQLRRAGFTGQIGGGTALGANALKALGDEADGIIYYSSFVGSDELSFASGRDFTSAFTAAVGEQPTTFNAETFDAFGFIQAAVIASGKVTPEGILAGMNEVATTGGFTGAQADPVSFDGRNAKTGGVIIEWMGGRETFAPGQ